MRDALKKDPTILRDAVAAMQDDGQPAAESEVRRSLGSKLVDRRTIQSAATRTAM